MINKTTITKKRSSTPSNGRSHSKPVDHRDLVTKSVLENAGRKAIREAEKETSKIMGFNLIVKKGWLVKVFPDNRIVRISRIPKIKDTK